MADKKEEKKGKEEKQQTEGTPEKSEAKSPAAAQPKASKGNLLLWIILGGTIIVSAAGGYGTGRLFARSGPPQTVKSEQPKEQQSVNEAVVEKAETEQSKKDIISIELEPVVANLDEPGITRYIRATLTIEMTAEAKKGEGEGIFESKKSALINWLTIYLAGLKLDQVRGSNNLKRIQTEIREVFNEMLYPDSKPKIERVLFKEFVVQ